MRKPILFSLGMMALGAGVYAYARREAGCYRRELIRVDGPNSDGKPRIANAKASGAGSSKGQASALRKAEGGRQQSGEWQQSGVERQHPGVDRTNAEAQKVELQNADVERHLPVRAEPRRLRILHISDLHLAGNESTRKLDFLAEVTDDEYDFVFLTGDIFQHDESIRHAQHLLSRRPRIGAYAVLGNHDYYRYSMFNKIVGRIFPGMRHPDKQNRDTEPLINALEDVGYEVLRNEARYLDDTGICVVGVDWPGIRKNRLFELVSRSPGDWLVLALFHLPRDLNFYNEAGVHYAFGGHTHGGQIRVPGFGAIITDSELARHEASGIVYRGRTTFHISRGLGADPRTNFRLFCPPQASVIDIEVPGNCSLATRADFSVIGTRD